MPDIALAPIRKALLFTLSDKARCFRLELGGQHLSGTVAGDLGQRIEHRSRLVKQADGGIVCHGVSLLREVLAGLIARHDTPPSQPALPKFGHSSENHIKAWKALLAADRTSCTGATANQLRLFLHAGAYWLMWTLRAALPRRSP